MPWMSDEQYELMQDTRDKKITARSARSTRTHNGKSGCTFSHERMTKKEIKAMSGECKTYRMNDPMTYDEFKALPNDLKVCYIQALRKKYNVPDKTLATAMGVNSHAFGCLIRELGLGLGKGAAGAAKKWPKTDKAVDFWTWWHGVDAEKAVEGSGTDELIAVNEDPEIKEYVENDIASTVRAASEILKRDMFNDESEKCGCTGEVRYALPSRGEMTFQGHIDEILRTVNKLLEGKDVWLEVKWIVRED
jgi:DNA-binding transcriptional regulator YiaG